jgi:predicted negative regulator of RcsB-dependent stress response
MGCSAATLICLCPPASQSAKDKKKPVDTQTRHALKQDKFAQAAASSADWISGHRAGVVRWAVIAVAVVVLGAGALIYWNWRSSVAEAALGQAIDLYNTPLALPGAPPEAGVYTTASARATEANREFVAIAHDFGWLPEGAKAHYFAGVSYMELGQNGNAETQLHAAAGPWDRNLANLAKLALAGLYHQTNRDSEAISLYNELTAKPSTTVSAGVAQLALADLYASEGKTDQARALWAKVKDADKDGAAGQIAEQKLGAK